MCDLIDLNSPDSKKLQATSKLASPLIPGPPTPVEKTQTNNIGFVFRDERSSLENNPFDKVFKESAEYAAKKNDPFESVLEKAQQQNSGKEYREDFTPKRRRHSDVLKMNKTLDEPLLQGILNKNFHLSRYQISADNFAKDFISPDSRDEDQAEGRSTNGLASPSIIVCPPSPGNCSVLNQSAMNDSLLEVKESPGKTERVPRVFVNLGETLTEEISNVEIQRGLPEAMKHRRSLSQGSKKLLQSGDNNVDPQSRPRSKSIVDNLKVSEFQSKSRASSASSASSGYADFANNAFMETGSVTNSESLDLSRISATPRLSCSSYGSIGSLNSCGAKNKAFILDSQSNGMLESTSSAKSCFNLSRMSATPISSCSSYELVGSSNSCNPRNKAFVLDNQSGGVFGSNSSAKSSFNLSGISRSAGNFLIKTPLKNPVRIMDLELRFEKLKLQSTASIGGLPLYSPNRKVQSFLKSDRAESEDGRDAQLIDTEGDCNVGRADSAANYSSDSVFIESSNIDQSVFQEAKLLARTFDELAHQTSNSFSSGDDLLYSRPRWNFDILPVSDDDEAVVDNLIELPVSPVKNETKAGSSPIKNVQEIADKKQAESKVSEEIKKLETEFIDQDFGRNKVMAATLLLDLEKIVHRENNPEAITLLENLERVLGVKYESNAQLLATCMQGTNNLSKSPKKYTSKLLGSNENIRHESLEKSEEDNNDVGLSDSLRIQKIQNDQSLGINLNIETAVNKSEKSIIANLSSAVEENRENLLGKSNNIPNVSGNEQKEIFVDQNEALELITNLSKILGGPNNDSSPLSLLTNLRQVLNLATNQLNFENAQITKSNNQESPEIDIAQEKPLAKPKVDALKNGRKKSIDSLTKVPNKTKRSMSFSGVQRNVVPTAAVLKEKAKPHSRSFKKALSCDAVPKPDKLEKSSSIVPEVARARTSTAGVTGKYKLKKKSESESVAPKKGPLKALLPVGNMQRRGSMSAKVAPISLSRTPPKSSSTTPPTFTSALSSTPNPTIALIASKQSPKTKPVASSTPDGGGSKARRISLQFSKNTVKPKFSCNISPVTPLPTHSVTGSVSSKGLPKNHRHNKTLSPPKRRSSQESIALNTTESSIPKYSPLSGFSRRNSKETIKALENSGSPKTSSNKSQTPKKSPFVNRKSDSQIPQSPLKTVNKQNSKFKPFNLISKLRRGSSGSNASDKENCA